MQVQVSGQHMSIGNSLNEYVSEKMQYVVLRYFAHAPSAHVYFSKQKNLQIECEIVVQEGTGRHMLMKSNDSDDNAYCAFNNALNKLERQLRRYKDKLNDYRKRSKLSDADSKAVKYILSRAPHDKADKDEEHEVLDTQHMTIEKISLNEAVMKMDLENLQVLVFKNDSSNRINVVYHKNDGNIAWVDYSPEDGK